MSSFTLGPDPLASMKLSMSSSSLSDAFLPPISRLESAESSSLSDLLPPSLSPTGDGSCEEGRCEEGPDDGTIDGTQDDATDDTLDAAADDTLDAAADTARNGAADVETKGDRDKWGMAEGTKNLVSLD